MQILSAENAKCGFGQLIDPAHSLPVAVTEHGQPVVVVLLVEEYERLKSLEAHTEREEQG